MAASATVLVGKTFDEDCEEIDVRWCEVSGAEVVVLGEKMAAGQHGKLRVLNLVRCVAFVATD